MRFFKQRTQTTTAVQQSSTTTTVVPLSPLDVNEILELIFSYLDNHTLSVSVVLVCRRWRLLNQNRLLREVYWHEDWKSSRKQRTACRLPGAGRLHCCLPFEGTREQNDIGKYSIRAVLGRLDAEYQKLVAQRKRDTALNNTHNNYNSRRQSTFRTWTTTSMPMAKAMAMPTLYDFTPLRELNLFINFNHGKSLNTFPFPPSLTKLSIALRFAFYSESDLSRIVRRCPLLESVSVETYATPGVTLTWSTPFEPKEIQSLPLRSLVLSHASFAQDHLENLLPHAPDLKELKLKGMRWTAGGNYDWTQLSACLRTHNITLDSVHFSIHGANMTLEEKEHFLTEVHPQSTRELTLWALDVTPQFLQTLLLPPTNLTSLELYWKPTAVTCFAYLDRQELDHAPRLIHQYLCESDCLLHLTTLKTAIQHKDLDLFGRAVYVDLDKGLDNRTLQETTFQHMSSATPTFPSSSSSPSYPPMFWRCRGLHTLHIEVLCPRMHLFEHPVQSRIVYGYISRVCPLLEELDLCLPQDNQPNAEGCLDLKAGLCLLGRLRHLQRLRVYSNAMDVAVGCKDWDVNWILDSGRKSVLSRKSRQEEVEGWQNWRINEDRVETERAQVRQLSTESGTSNNYNRSTSVTDTAILDRLGNLGLLLEVEEMIREIDAGEIRPLPNLERLSFKYPIMLQPKEELQRMFPTRLEKLRRH
ncbi:hypothetical protein K457DRAFT_131951 [Linnemannia elongata AG-77]|uniref:Uncharacterized protein n=1 Tax=Linnemannia elongata AG-77 TaxID=1314771 RepID=A0A197KGF5_9FUNG|nr:hypothetical protein K457DRAFT_131951 [Linnemannia elongata AG-77]